MQMRHLAHFTQNIRRDFIALFLRMAKLQIQ
ncbi:Uncharacterised protein [Vibrio cholerae]|nr:Uncharacterised protein [Vibrio cholerae]